MKFVQEDTPEEIEFWQKLKPLADRYNQLTYGNQPDPAESSKEFFFVVGGLSLVIPLFYVILFLIVKMSS